MTAKRALAVFGTGVAAAQAGHLLAYWLRFGAVAPGLQGAGAHAYFPSLAKTGLAVGALALLAALLLIGAARIVSGRRVDGAPGLSFGRLLAVLFTVQLACFAGQETVESLLGGTHAGSAPLLLLWGAAGQLPVALVAAVALRWIDARVRPALAVLRTPLPAAMDCVLAQTPWRPWPLAAKLAPVEVGAGSYLRGPPSF